MALGTPTLVTPTIGTSGTFDQTALYTPTLGALLVTFGSSRAAVLTGALVFSTNALTWTEIGQALYDSGSGARIRAGAWATVVDVVTPTVSRVDSASAAKTCVSVVQITGAGGLPSNFASAVDGSGDPTVTLGITPAATSTVLGYIAAAGATAITAPAGYLELDEFVSNADLIAELAHDAGSAVAGASWSTGNQGSVALLVEVAEAVAGGASRVPIRSRFSHMLIR